MQIATENHLRARPWIVFFTTLQPTHGGKGGFFKMDGQRGILVTSIVSRLYGEKCSEKQVGRGRASEEQKQKIILMLSTGFAILIPQSIHLNLTLAVSRVAPLKWGRCSTNSFPAAGAPPHQVSSGMSWRAGSAPSLVTPPLGLVVYSYGCLTCREGLRYFNDSISGCLTFK